MAKKNRKNETRESIMYPNFHSSVVAAVAPHFPHLRFNNDADDPDITRTWHTHVMGRFTCAKGHAWYSKKIAIVIRKYRNNEYNAEVYNQRCRACNKLGRISLDKDAYVERVAHRLKKWAGLEVERPPVGKKQGPPHDSELCEGCKRGVCREGGDGEDFRENW